jgi:Tfp pilus assembly protein PilO
MLRTIISGLMIIAAVIGVVAYVVPTFKSAQEIKVEEQELDNALANSRRLQERRAELTEQFNAFTDNEKDTLETLLPDNIDNVNLIIELDALASRHGLAIQNINVVNEDQDAIEDGATVVSSNQDYDSVQLQFSLEGPYEPFVDFVEDVERSLRLIDVESIAFQSVAGSNSYQYDVLVRTYWLK